MNIIIYDDNLDDINHLVNCLHNLFKKIELEHHIDICNSKEELFNNINNYDLLFLDIEINNENGIDIGLELQKHNVNCRIIITSNYTKYAIDGYKINAERYFIKPIDQTEFNIEMSNFIKKYIHRSLSLVDNKICSQKIVISNILYIEFINRKSLIHLINRKTIKSNSTLKYIYEKLSDYGFDYSHKSYLVNFEYISAFEKEHLVLFNNERIPLSRHFKKEFENNYQTYLFNNL